MTLAMVHRYTLKANLLRDRGRAAASRAFMALPAVTDDDFEGWLDDVRPITNGAASASAQLASAYVSYVAGVAIVKYLNGKDYTQEQIGVQPFDVRYRDPFIAFYNALGNGKSPDEARDIGASRAGLIVDEDSQWAATTAMKDTGDALAEVGRTIVAYQRIPEPDACSFCEQVAGARTRTDDLAPLHAACGCGVEPIFA